MTLKQEWTPKELTAYLDRYIIGQDNAKKAVAVAIRNRYRRSLLSENEKKTKKLWKYRIRVPTPWDEIP